MKVIPVAIGQSDDTLVLWDDNPELSEKLSQKTLVVSELKWGVGVLDKDPCLILYLFLSGESFEVYLPAALPTSPNEEVDVWSTLWDWNPEILKLRYGVSPVDKEQEVTLLLPKATGETLMVKLKEFIFLTKKQNTKAMPPLYEELLERLEEITAEEQN